MGLYGKYNSNTRVVVKCLYKYMHSSEQTSGRGVPAVFMCPYPGRICFVRCPDCSSFNS